MHLKFELWNSMHLLIKRSLSGHTEVEGCFLCRWQPVLSALSATIWELKKQATECNRELLCERLPASISAFFKFLGVITACRADIIPFRALFFQFSHPKMAVLSFKYIQSPLCLCGLRWGQYKFGKRDQWGNNKCLAFLKKIERWGSRVHQMRLLQEME